MRAHLADFDVACPATLDEALALLAAGVTRPGGMTPMAGATDLYVPFAAGHVAPTTFLSLHAVAEFRAPALSSIYRSWISPSIYSSTA